MGRNEARVVRSARPLGVRIIDIVLSRLTKKMIVLEIAEMYAIKLKNRRKMKLSIIFMNYSS